MQRQHVQMAISYDCIVVRDLNFITCRCWFGKEPGKYIDYIYQGPVILVLLVSETHLKLSVLQFCDIF